MAEVYRLPELGNPARLRKLLQAVADIEKGSLVAVKLHMGELINYRFIRPPFVRELVAAIKEAGGKPFLTDTTTIYPRARHNAVDYLETARQNGFNFATVGAPVIIADGLKGETGVMVETGGTLLTEIELGQAIYEADYLVAVAHCTGHIIAGYAGAIKNLGMGCTTKNGKRAVHRFSIPVVDADTCERCESCVDACPYAAVHLEDAPIIDARICVGCSRCIPVCPTGAVTRKFGDQLCYLNFLTDVTAMCDCTFQKAALVPDLGALASRDLLSVEQASYDLLKESAGRDVLREVLDLNGEFQFSIAELLGMGERPYTRGTLK
jgi:uncharacterized Fe-S center protein